MARRRITWALLGAGAAALACTSGNELAASPAAAGPGSAVSAPSAAPASTSPDATVPPTPGPCDEPGRTGAERVKCKFDALADQGIATADALAASPLRERLSPGQRQAVEHLKARMIKEKERGADRMRSLSRKREARCRPAECDGTVFPACPIGNGDGVCDEQAGEACLEVVGDGAGDDQQPCAPMRGAHREECVQVCDDDAVCREADNLDPALEAHFEGQLDEATNHARAVERGLQGARVASAAALGALAAVQASGDPCALDAHGHERTSDELAKGFKTAAVHSRGLADVAERACDQNVLGFSCGACCAPFEVIAAVAALASDLVEIMDDVVSSATLDAALSCVKEVNLKASENDAAMRLVQEGLLRVEAMQEEIVRLLQTPPGLRPEHPQP